MELKKLEVEVSKEAHELGEAVAKLVLATKQALADGFQVGQDVPAIVMTAFAELPKAIEGLDKLDDEAKAHLKPFVMALTLPIADAVEALLKKQA
jgi:hypothetical protein